MAVSLKSNKDTVLILKGKIWIDIFSDTCSSVHLCSMAKTETLDVT